VKVLLRSYQSTIVDKRKDGSMTVVRVFDPAMCCSAIEILGKSRRSCIWSAVHAGVVPTKEEVGQWVLALQA
jgi:hypothetical protein